MTFTRIVCSTSAVLSGSSRVGAPKPAFATITSTGPSWSAIDSIAACKRLTITDIRHGGKGRPAGRNDRRGRRVELNAAARDQADPITGCPELNGQCAADAARGPGDNRDLASLIFPRCQSVVSCQSLHLPLAAAIPRPRCVSRPHQDEPPGHAMSWRT